MKKQIVIEFEAEDIAGLGNIGDTIIDECECVDGDETYWVINAIDLVCEDCGAHQPHFTD